MGRRRADGVGALTIIKKAPPGQTLFFHFLFSGPVLKESKIFSGPDFMSGPHRQYQARYLAIHYDNKHKVPV